MKLCDRCNRKLKSEKSQAAGMGPVCKRKSKEEAADEEFKKMQITIFDVELNDGGTFDEGTMHACT